MSTIGFIGPLIGLAGPLIGLTTSCQTFDRPRGSRSGIALSTIGFVVTRLTSDRHHRRSPDLSQALLLLFSLRQPAWWPRLTSDRPCRCSLAFDSPRGDLPQALTFSREGPHHLDLLCGVPSMASPGIWSTMCAHVLLYTCCVWHALSVYFTSLRVQR